MDDQPTHVAEAVAAEMGVALVRGDRQADYGHPLVNHQRIADFWNARLGEKLAHGQRIEPHDVAACMRLVKEARLMNSPGHFDSLVDIAGYTEVERMIHEAQSQMSAGRPTAQVG